MIKIQDSYVYQRQLLIFLRALIKKKPIPRVDFNKSFRYPVNAGLVIFFLMRSCKTFSQIPELIH